MEAWSTVGGVAHRSESTDSTVTSLGIVGVDDVPGRKIQVAAGCERRWIPDVSRTKRDLYCETIPIQPLGDAELLAHKVSKFIRWVGGWGACIPG